jgi:hypothetical protein
MVIEGGAAEGQGGDWIHVRHFAVKHQDWVVAAWLLWRGWCQLKIFLKNACMSAQDFSSAALL